MTQPGPVDLARLRRRPHRTKLWLGIYQPTTALACQVNSSGLVQGDYIIPFDNISEGSYLYVESGMTLYVGTQPGGHDVGRIRIKQALGNMEMIVAENNDIVWADNLYLTVVRFFEPWAVYPRIELVNDVPIFYKDYDIPYTDQNELFDPVVCMGPHHAGFRTTGAHDVYYSSSGSFDPTDGALPTGYVWRFEGAEVTGSFEAGPGEIPYSVPGHYTTHLLATTGFGKSLTGRRHIMIFDRPGEGPDVPIVDWGMLSFEGSRDQYGYGLKLFVREDADFAKVVPGALVVIFSEDWYGDEEVSIGGNAAGRSSILFCGYIEEESIAYNSYTSRLEFRAASVTQLMDIKATFSVSLEDAANPGYWYEMQDMIVDRAAIHYLRWHSTVLHIADFSQTGDTKSVQYIDFGRGTLLNEAANMYESTLGADFVADRQGKIWAEIDPNLMATGTRTQTEIMELERQDWIGQVDFSREFYEHLSYLEAGGIAYSGRTGTMFPLLSGAPGEAPSYHGGVSRISGLVLTGQAQLNEWTGLAFARANNLYPELSMDLAGDYRYIDIAPREFLPITLEASDTYRGLVWNKKRFMAKSIAFRYEPKNETLYYMSLLEGESEGPPGETVIIPVDPPWDSPTIPIPVMPPLPPLPPPPIPPPLPGGGELVYVCSTNKLTRSRNFGAANPLDTTWDDITPTNADGVTGSFQTFYLDPVDPENRCYLITLVNPLVLSRGSRLYRGEYLNSIPVWTLLMDNTDWRTLWSGGADTICNDIGIQRAFPNVLWAVGRNSDSGADSLSFAWSVDYGVTWTDRTPSQDWRPVNLINTIIDASEWNTAAAFTSGHQQAGNDVGYSNNAGVTWAGSAFNIPMDFHVPYQGNEGDQEIYVSENQAQWKQLMWSPDRAGGGKIDISPYFDGYYWACARSGVTGGMYRNIRSAWNNSNIVHMMLHRRITEPSDVIVTTYFRSFTGHTGLIPQRQFSGRITCLLVHRNNDDLLYSLSPYAAPGDVQKGHILFSPDGGDSWYDYRDSWERDIGTMGVPDSVGFSPIRIEPAWTV